VHIPGAIAVFLLLSALVTLGLRHAGTRRPPRPVRSRAGRAGGGRSRPRTSWPVTAAQAAGVKLTSDHLGGASAELTGRAAGGLTRAGGRLARRGGQRLAALSARRWQARGDSVRQPLFLTRIRNDSGTDSNSRSDSGVASRGDGDTGGGSGPRPDTPAAGRATGTGPASGGRASVTSAPQGARREIHTMRHRYAVNLERPSTDAEFLESTVQLGDVLKSLAEEVSEWADSLSGLKLPSSVLGPLHQVSEGIEEAATGAAQSAKAFEDEFEDARDVASHGMHFTGEDAA
jgi:hypothetical protein